MQRFLLYMMLMCVNIAQAQRAHFTDTSNKWYVNASYSEPGVWQNCSRLYSYRQNISLGRYNYQLLSHNGSCSSSHAGSWTYTDADSALIREDTSVKKVFARIYIYEGNYTNDTSEFLLYDYNLQMGDTLTTTSKLGSFKYYVSNKDSILINGVYHNRWVLTNTSSSFTSYTVVEGVGSFADPLFPYKPLQGLSGSIGLVCFSDKNVGNNPNNPSWYYNCALGISDNKIKPENIKVYPNPASRYVVFNYELSAVFSNLTLTITDVSGRIVKETRLASNKCLFHWHTNEIQNGVYFYKISDSKTQHGNGKVVIMK